MENKETYKVDALCTNCGAVKVVKIPKGATAVDYLMSEVCGHCGCTTLVKGHGPYCLKAR